MMAPMLEPASEKRNFRLKNKKLVRLVRDAQTWGQQLVEERLEDMLCSPFILPAFLSLLPHELAILEATCRCLRGALNGENAALVWVASAYAVSRGRRVILPVHALASMSLPHIKHTLANMQNVRGAHNGSEVTLADGFEFEAVSSICNQMAATKAQVTTDSARIVIGRTSLCQHTPTHAACEDTVVELGGDIDEACAISEMAFCWPEGVSSRKGTMLVASLALLDSFCLLQVSSVLKPLNSPISLFVDVHLFSPLWPEGLSRQGIQLRVDGSCTVFELPECDIAELDIADAQDGEALESPLEDVLCILVLRNSAHSMPEIQSPLVRAISSQPHMGIVPPVSTKCI